MSEHKSADGSDFAAGIAMSALIEGATLAGRVGDHPVLLSRRNGEIFAVSGACTHYGAPLSRGLAGDGRVMCPWHHACFDLATGEALGAPAFDALQRWRVDIENDTIFVRAPVAQPLPRPIRSAGPKSIVIVGGGAAGFAAGEMLRRRGFAGALTMLSADAAPPCDRPNLSKDYLAGEAPEEWIPLKDAAFYREQAIDLRLGVQAAALDVRNAQLTTVSGERFAYDALLLATGAAPIRLSGSGFDKPNVYLLRSLADTHAIIAAAASAKRVAIVGASFIGLETAASLRHRGLDVAVVAPDEVPLARVMGPGIGGFVKALHEARGVRFHLKRRAAGFDGKRLLLDDGGAIEADFVVLGVGVRPNTEIAAAAGLTIDNGVVVDGRLRTSAANIYAAGDVANYPDVRTGERIRVEHWVAAERQGQAVALSMLGESRARFSDTPFFWSKHYDSSLRYVGHASTWDAIDVDGAIDNADFTARFMRAGRVAAAVSLGRDRESLEIHSEMDREAQSLAG